jgi:signal transduction histidine kinase
VQISAAQELLKVDPSQLHSRLEKLEEIIRLAIGDVRKEVSKLRDDKAILESWRTRWLRLCTTFSDCTGIRIHTNIADNLRTVDDIIGTTIYRIIQESLTNAYRHGRSHVVDVAMEWQESNERILLRISDDGRGADNPHLGNGLKGIRERVYNLGGEMVLQTKPYKGFDIGITIPWQGEILDEEDTSLSSRRSSLVS